MEVLNRIIHSVIILFLIVSAILIVRLFDNPVYTDKAAYYHIEMETIGNFDEFNEMSSKLRSTESIIVDILISIDISVLCLIFLKIKLKCKYYINVFSSNVINDSNVYWFVYLGLTLFVIGDLINNIYRSYRQINPSWFGEITSFDLPMIVFFTIITLLFHLLLYLRIKRKNSQQTNLSGNVSFKKVLYLFLKLILVIVYLGGISTANFLIPCYFLTVYLINYFSNENIEKDSTKLLF